MASVVHLVVLLPAIATARLPDALPRRPPVEAAAPSQRGPGGLGDCDPAAGGTRRGCAVEGRCAPTDNAVDCAALAAFYVATLCTMPGWAMDGGAGVWLWGCVVWGCLALSGVLRVRGG